MVTSDLTTGYIQFKAFNGYWKGEFSVPHLKNINLHFESGKLYGVAGRVGSGKSGILGAILQEIPYYSGSLEMKGKVAYVEQ